MDRETVTCPFCAAAVGQPCDFQAGPWTVVEDGVPRRVVHAARYAQTLSEADAAAFWGGAVDRYLAEQLAALGDDTAGGS